MEEFKKIAKFYITLIGGVFFWRGAWIACDLYIFPNDIELSMWFCLISGVTIIFLMEYRNL